MPDNEVKFSSGGTSSKQPRLELIPFLALLRAAERFELGIRNRPDGSAWNALSPNFKSCCQDKEFAINRAAHVAEHAMKLKAILSGEIPDDGDDHAGAILWGGCFLSCVQDAREGMASALNCSACGGDGKLHVTDIAGERDASCPSCHGSGKARPAK